MESNWQYPTRRGWHGVSLSLLPSKIPWKSHLMWIVNVMDYYYKILHRSRELFSTQVAGPQTIYLINPLYVCLKCAINVRWISGLRRLLSWTPSVMLARLPTRACITKVILDKFPRKSEIRHTLWRILDLRRIYLGYRPWSRPQIIHYGPD